MGNLRTIRLLVVFAVALSLGSLAGPLSGTLHLPTITPVRANPAPATNWIPAGPSTNTMIQSIFSDDTAEQVGLLNEQVDLTDVALTQCQALSLLGGPGCSPVDPTHFYVTSPIGAHDVFELQFLQTNNYWGVPFNYGKEGGCAIPAAVGVGVNDALCPGVSVRQAIAHLVDKTEFCNLNLKVNCGAADNDAPLSDGLIAPDPCGWDALFLKNGPSCIATSPPTGGTAYHLNSTNGVVGHDTGGVAAAYGWEPAADNGGKADLCAAAQHLVVAGVAAGFNPMTCVLFGVGPNAAAHPVNIFAQVNKPALLALGNGLFQDVCYLFTGHWSDPTCQLIPTPTSPCTGLCYVTETVAPTYAFPGFATSNAAINNNWWIFTSGFYGSLPFDTSGAFFFDNVLYNQFNSINVSGGIWDKPPCSASSVASTSAPNYEYSCVPAFDTISNQMEFAPCVGEGAGDPTNGQSATGNGPPVTFANCSGGNVVGACGGLTCTAVSAGYQTEDLYGKLELSVPIYTPIEQFGYRAAWNRVINSQGSSIPNSFTWLNAYNTNFASTTPVGPDPNGQTLTQGFAASARSLNPYAATTPLDFQTIGRIYDSIGKLNPANNVQYFDYLAYDHAPTTLSLAASISFDLRPDVFWQSDSSMCPNPANPSTLILCHPVQPLTGWDVEFSYMTLKQMGSFQSRALSDITSVTATRNKVTINFANSVLPPVALLTIAGITIIPGRYWSASCSYTTWDNDVNSGAVPPACMTVTPQMASIAFDPLASAPNNVPSCSTVPCFPPGILIGSGPFQCQSSIGVVGSGCSSTGTQNPPFGGTYVLTRFGCNRATGTCNVPGSRPTTTYFRSAGTLALYIWSGMNGSGHDNTLISLAALCFNKPVGTPQCAQWQRGIGNPGAGSPVSIVQLSILVRFLQDGNWVFPFNWLPGIPLACCPFTSNAPAGIDTPTPVLYEGTVQLNPCNIDPVNGYDC